MIALKLISSFVFITGLIIALIYSCTILPKRLNHYFNEKYNFKPFTATTIILSLLSAPLLIFGWKIFQFSNQSNGDISNGIVIISIGAIFSAILLFNNIKNSGIFLGTGLTLLSLVTFGILALIIGAFIFIFIILPLISVFFPRNIYIRYY